MTAPFIVLGLRSRTYWLSKFLSYADWRCGHGEALQMRTPADLASWAALPKTGTAGSALAPWWRLFPVYAPGVRIVTVRRDPGEIENSLRRHGAFPDWEGRAETVRRFCRKLDQIEKRVPGVLSVRFEDLAHEDTCAAVFEHCLPYRHDPAWWASMADVNLQQDTVAQNRYAAVYGPQIAKMARTARHLSLRAMDKAPPPLEGFEIGVEPFETAWADAGRALRDHMAATDQDVEEYLRKNVPLLTDLSRRGRAFCAVARSNGRVFGYQLALIGNDLDSEKPIGCLASVYAPPEVPGLGRRLRRTALDYLRGKGMTKIYGRWGVRGSGARVAAIDKRMGAESIGEAWVIETKEAA
jgi:hypothetical protein